MTGEDIRSATVADAPAIERVARAAWHDTYDAILGPEAVDAKLEEWYDPDDLRQSIEAEQGVFFVSGEDPVGFAQATPGDDVWHLGRIYVDPDHRGEGIGTGLLDRVESALERRGVTRYELAVLSENGVGVGFYEARGFERVDERAVELAGVETTEYWYRKRL